MRRPTPLVVRLTRATAAGLAVGASVLAVSGCSGDATPTPTVASANFAPRLEVTVGPTGAPRLRQGENDQATSATVPVGSTIAVTNTSAEPQRITGTLDGDPSIDTGTLDPGETTTVVLTNAGTVELATDGVDGQVTVTVTPADS